MRRAASSLLHLVVASLLAVAVAPGGADAVAAHAPPSASALPAVEAVARIYPVYDDGATVVGTYRRVFATGPDCVRTTALLTAPAGVSADYRTARLADEPYGRGLDVPHTVVLRYGRAAAARRAVQDVRDYAARCAGGHRAHGEVNRVALLPLPPLGQARAAYRGFHRSSYGREHLVVTAAARGRTVVVGLLFNAERPVRTDDGLALLRLQLTSLG